MSSNLACNNSNSMSCQRNQVSCTPDCSSTLVSCTLFSSSSPISLYLVHNSTISAEHKVKSSLSISACNAHGLTPSRVFPEYSIQARLFVFPFLHDYELTPQCPFSFPHASCCIYGLSSWRMASVV